MFVTGTDTEVGKTVVAGAVCAALRARGADVAAFKPVVTGIEEPSETGWPADHELLAAVTGERPADVAPVTFGPAVSPHLAAELAGVALEPASLVAAARAAADRAELLVVEGVGGLMVPLTLGYSIRDLARELALPLVVAARPALGTINHTLLTLEAARGVGLTVAGVVLTPWPSEPSALQRSNKDSIQRLGGVAVSTLPVIPEASAEALAAAGATLPLDAWLS
jgi:dethiobiotin synthetase